MAALKKYFCISVFSERRDLIEIIDTHYHRLLSLARPSGEAKPFSNPERGIEHIKGAPYRAIALIQYLTGARIDDVPKVVQSLKDWKEGTPPHISIARSKGGRSRRLDLSDREEDFRRVREAVAVLSPEIQEKGCSLIKKAYYPALRKSAAFWGESYAGAHGLRVNFPREVFNKRDKMEPVLRGKPIKR